MVSYIILYIVADCPSVSSGIGIGNRERLEKHPTTLFEGICEGLKKKCS